MDKNKIIYWYYDHSKRQNVKGMNIRTAFYTARNEKGEIRTHLNYQIAAKTEKENDPKMGKEDGLVRKRA